MLMVQTLGSHRLIRSFPRSPSVTWGHNPPTLMVGRRRSGSKPSASGFESSIGSWKKGGTNPQKMIQHGDQEHIFYERFTLIPRIGPCVYTSLPSKSLPTEKNCEFPFGMRNPHWGCGLFIFLRASSLSSTGNWAFDLQTRVPIINLFRDPSSTCFILVE